ncbi:hypothetical protein JVX93_15885 [Mycolicibacterium boenickei]|nr:hypothetical protein JVX93_15885 [Mycolicibacterium boenickei]
MRDPYEPFADEQAAAAEHDWTAERAAARRTNRLQAIADCQLCDPDGYRGTTVCDHTDHTETARRGIAAIRAQMGWPATGTPEPD